jgi:hypothetical protein
MVVNLLILTLYRKKDIISNLFQFILDIEIKNGPGFSIFVR